MEVAAAGDGIGGLIGPGLVVAEEKAALRGGFFVPRVPAEKVTKRDRWIAELRENRDGDRALATLATGPWWTDHMQEGVCYSVRHVLPSFVDYPIPAIARTARKPGRAALTLKVRIIYSHHCFTQALAKLAGANPEHYYNCTRRPHDPRVFCTLRWNESLALPEIVAGIRNCYFTRHHNYFVWRDPTAAMSGEYFVYFNVTRRGTFVEIEIESAYPRVDAKEAKAGARKVSLTTLIVNAANGRKTHRPPS